MELLDSGIDGNLQMITDAEKEDAWGCSSDAPDFW